MVKENIIRIKEINSEIKRLEKIISEKEDNWNFNKSFEEYKKMISEEKNEIYKLSREKRMIMSYELSDLPNYGDVMSIKEFIECVEDGGFVDYDGYGCYVEGDKMTNIYIYPSDIKYNSIRGEFEKMIWFNR